MKRHVDRIAIALQRRHVTRMLRHAYLVPFLMLQDGLRQDRDSRNPARSRWVSAHGMHSNVMPRRDGASRDSIHVVESNALDDALALVRALPRQSWNWSLDHAWQSACRGSANLEFEAFG